MDYTFIPRAAQAPVVTWSSCEIRIMAKLYVWVCMGIFTTAPRNKNTVKFSIKIPRLTSTVHRLLPGLLLYWKEPILASYPFLGLLPIRDGEVINPEMDKLVILLMEARWGIFKTLKTLKISSWLLFRKMIISQLKHRPTVVIVYQRRSISVSLETYPLYWTT